MKTELTTYVSVMHQIKQEIVSGAWEPGQKLNSIKSLADRYNVNPNTVQRALSNLEEEGLLRGCRTAGKYVTENTLLIKSIRYKEARKVTEEFVSTLEHLGINPGELVKLFAEPDLSIEQATS